ncbi:hypothetical protein JZO77_07585 [Enterococcus hulanensis]|uniref:hypothetical protein n=1 Tax=Enterococcus hulanensis TaxID=2559929 RepID=UPI001A8DC0B2|nr:hypothetical protein [Enterococcus hulanensis]MBO0456595.1 hypothetical protein [Enterococcus hulanensis]
MKRYGLGVVLLGLFLVLVGCGSSLSKMDDGTKKAVSTVMDFKNKYHKKNNEKRKNYEFDSGYLPTDLSEKDVLQVYLMKAKQEENNVYYIRYNETEFSDPNLKKKMKDHIRGSAATSNGTEFEPISEKEFKQAIEQDSVDKIFEAKE